ncbi:carbohydrate ABC transporter permease [Nonomuraea rhodomycinica]|uniref:carbohydrate ABC transporter permease n=1 Tax=Nonomuraea rhodomycinica TaxID=1712872 RepID=UPI0028A59B13|nr:sugar ABC transporter permease [Nonomuraea rhodomycinica]
MTTRSPILGRFRYGYVAPAALLVAGLLYAPFVWTAYLSLTRYDGLAPPEWAGLANFGKLFDDPALLTSLRNTLLWVVGTMVLPVGLGLLVAVLSHDIKGGAWYRVPFMLPYALSGAGLALVWSPILSHGGIANVLLGVDTAFLQSAPVNTLAMLLVWTWQQLGVNTLLFVVGLQSIPKEPIEAARLDGASGWRLFRHITWPLMRPLTAVVVGLALVASLKTFDIVWVLTQGGPGRNSETLAVTMYKETFVASDYGYGSAVAVMLTVVTGLASYLYLKRQVAS